MSWGWQGTLCTYWMVLQFFPSNIFFLLLHTRSTHINANQANLHGNHVNNTGQLVLSSCHLVELRHHLPLPPPLLLLLHHWPNLAGPEFGFESWIQTETWNFPHFQGGVCNLGEHPHGCDMVVLPGAVQGSVRILFSYRFRVDPVKVLQDEDLRVLPVLEQKMHIGSFPIWSQILQQIVLQYGLATHLQASKCILHLTDGLPQPQLLEWSKEAPWTCHLVCSPSTPRPTVGRQFSCGSPQNARPAC